MIPGNNPIIFTVFVIELCNGENCSWRTVKILVFVWSSELKFFFNTRPCKCRETFSWICAAAASIVSCEFYTKNMSIIFLIMAPLVELSMRSSGEYYISVIDSSITSFISVFYIYIYSRCGIHFSSSIDRCTTAMYILAALLSLYIYILYNIREFYRWKLTPIMRSYRQPMDQNTRLINNSKKNNI